LFKEAHDSEADERSVEINQAWDDVNYVDLESDDDFIQKASAIVADEEYDTRVDVPLNLPDNQLFELMKLAHEADMTLNQYVEKILRQAIDEFNDTAPHITNTDNPIDFPKPKKKKKAKRD
jgi:hypothetical protein